MTPSPPPPETPGRSDWLPAIAGGAALLILLATVTVLAIVKPSPPTQASNRLSSVEEMRDRVAGTDAVCLRFLPEDVEEVATCIPPDRQQLIFQRFEGQVGVTGALNEIRKTSAARGGILVVAGDNWVIEFWPGLQEGIARDVAERMAGKVITE